MMYAPVRRLSDVTVKNGRLSGRAYPEADEPGAIELVSGPHVVGTVRAERDAAWNGNGGRWQEGCGFGIELRPADFVFSDELVLRCAVSKEDLHVIHFGAVEWPAPPEITEVSVADILAKDGEGAPNQPPDAEPLGAERDRFPDRQLMEKWRQLIFPELAPDDFETFIGALAPDSPERAALLALAELRGPRAPETPLAAELQRLYGKTAAHPGLEDGNGSNP